MMSSSVKMVWSGDEVKIYGQKAVNKTAYEVGLIIEGQAKLLCPIDLGYLAASINTQSSTQGTDLGTVVAKPKAMSTQAIGESTKYTKGPSKKEQQRNFWEQMPDGFVKINRPADPNMVQVGTAVEYGPYIEFGTVKMNAQPFLRPAMDIAKGKVLTLLKDAGKYFFGDYLRRPL